MPAGAYKYDEARVRELAQSLERYFDDTSSLFFESWAASEKLHMRQVRRFVESNEEFAEAFERCGTIQAGRLLEGSTRLMDVTTNRVVYAVNPKTACLVLTAKHSYKDQKEITLTEDGSHQTLTDMLRAQMPKDAAEARVWLQSVADGQGADPQAQAVQEAAKGELELLNMLDEATRIGSVIVGMEPQSQRLMERTRNDGTTEQ